MSCNLSYNLSISGDCLNSNLGSFKVEINGTAPDYTIQWIDPASYGTIVLGAGVTAYTQTNLSAGTYTFNVIDSCSPLNTVLPINVNISSGTCVTVSNSENTICGEDNGVISAVTTNDYGNVVFYLYDINDTFISSANTPNNFYEFNSLSAGTYYVVADDGGGCTGKSETVIILSSTTLDYGLFVVNDAGCAVDSGKIFITGLTGNPPFTYLWNTIPAQTTSSITGLSAGSYFVTVTDNTGCSVTKTGIVVQVPPIGIVSILTTDPSCFSSDGEMTVIVSGGTAPYNFSASTLGNYYTFDNEYTFTNVGSGVYNILVTDAGLCNTSSTATLTTPGGLSIIDLTYSPSTCGTSGFLNIQLNGGTPPYVYTLAKTGGPITTQTNNNSLVLFNNLTYGDYTLTITDGGPCEFSTEFTIENGNTTEVTTNVTGTTCGNNNGIINVVAVGSAPNYTFVLDGIDVQTAISSVTYTNLVSGSHTITVSDSSGCVQTITQNIAASSGVDFILVGSDALFGNDGSITASITQGVAPFTWTWSPNVNGQTNLTVNNLTAGTYSLTVEDSVGCEKTKTITLNGNSVVSSYQVYNICDSDLANYGELLIKGPKQMLLEGFNTLTMNDVNCILNQSIFTAEVTVSGITTTNSFYTGYTLNDYPTTQAWANVVKDLLEDYEGIGQVTYNVGTNKFTISTDCESEVSLNDVTILVVLSISYDISCVSCD